MSKLMEKRLREVRRRCSANLLLEQLAKVGTGCALVALPAILIERLFALHVWRPELGYGLAVAFGLGVLGLWLAKLPSPRRVSLILDERLRFRDRFSTTLALAHSEDPFAQAARTEAHQALEACQVGSHFPIRPTRSWRWTAGAWCVVLVLVLALPQKDLLGFLRRDQQEEAERAGIELAQKQIDTSTGLVTRVVSQLDDPNLQEDLGALAGTPLGAPPQEAKRQAIRRLTNLSDKLKDRQANLSSLSHEMLKQMLKQLKPSPNGLSMDLNKAMARGQFSKASQLLRDLQRRIQEDDLTEEEKQAFQQQLKDLGRQLARLSRASQELEKALEEQGLPKEYARKNLAHLRKALEDRGLTPEQLDELLEKFAASRRAASRCAALGQALGSGAAGGMSGDELAAAMGLFDELDSEDQKLKLSEAALAEIERAIACLGQGLCEGLGGDSPFRTGTGDRWGMGSGGPGRGSGRVASDSEGQFSTKATRTKNQSREGPVIASWYFQGEQVRGEARRKFKEVVAAGRDSAAEAVQENQIPRKYEQSVKEYFGHLEAQTDAP